MNMAPDRSQVVQGPQVSPKTSILFRLGWGAFSKSASNAGIFTVFSKLRHANKRNEWGQKLVSCGKESFSKKGRTVVGPLQRPASCGVWALSPTKPVASRSTYGMERGRYTGTENFQWARLWESCVDSGDQPAGHELSRLGKDKCANFGPTNGREGWKNGPGPQWSMSISSLENVKALWEFSGY